MAFPMASVIGTDGKSRVFFLDSTGMLERWVINSEPEKIQRELQYTKETVDFKGSQPAPGGKSIAAVAYEWGSVNSLRVFFVDKSNKLQELCKDGSGPWFVGSLGAKQLSADPNLSLTALANTKDSSKQLKVYYYLPSAGVDARPQVAWTTLGLESWVNKQI